MVRGEAYAGRVVGLVTLVSSNVPVAAVAIERTTSHIAHASAQEGPPLNGPDSAGAGFGSRRSGVELRPLPGLARLGPKSPRPDVVGQGLA